MLRTGHVYSDTGKQLNMETSCLCERPLLDQPPDGTAASPAVQFAVYIQLRRTSQCRVQRLEGRTLAAMNTSCCAQVAARCYDYGAGPW